MANRRFEDAYAQDRLYCAICKKKHPVASFQLPGQKPNHKKEKFDWWELFYVASPYGMWEGFKGIGVPNTYETLCERWNEELGTTVTPQDVRKAIARGRISLGNARTGMGYVIAYPWEQCMFCKTCRDCNYPDVYT